MNNDITIKIEHVQNVERRMIAIESLVEDIHAVPSSETVACSRAFRDCWEMLLSPSAANQEEQKKTT